MSELFKGCIKCFFLGMSRVYKDRVSVCMWCVCSPGSGMRELECPQDLLGPWGRGPCAGLQIGPGSIIPVSPARGTFLGSS